MLELLKSKHTDQWSALAVSISANESMEATGAIRAGRPVDDGATSLPRSQGSHDEVSSYWWWGELDMEIKSACHLIDRSVSCRIPDVV